MSGQCGLTLEVTDLRPQEQPRERPLRIEGGLKWPKKVSWRSSFGNALGLTRADRGACVARQAAEKPMCRANCPSERA